MNFLPPNYNYKKNSIARIIKVFILIIMVLNICISMQIYNNKKQLGKVNREIKMNSMNTNKKHKKIKYIKEDSINTFKDFYELSNSYITCDTLKVKGKTLTVQGKSEGIENYIKFLQDIQNNKYYKIKNFNELKKQEDSIKFSMELEMIK